MSQVITKRFRVSRRRFLQGLTLAGSAVQVGLPPLVSMFNSTGTAYAAEAWPRNPSRAASCSGSTATASRSGTGFPARPARTITSRRASGRWPRSATTSTCSAAWTTGGQCLRPRQRPSQVDERRHDLHPVHRPRRRRTVHRPGHRRQNRRRFALPLAPDRRLAGIVRREHPAQHELGRIRPPAAAGDDAATSSSTACSARAKKAGSTANAASSTPCGRTPRTFRKQVPKDDAVRVEEHLSAIRDLERAIAGLPPSTAASTRRTTTAT